MGRTIHRGAAAAAILSLLVAAPGPAAAGPGDARIHHELGLAAEARGDIDEAYRRFGKACMASDGLADSCLKWAELARERGEGKDLKRALSSAVMLAPEDIRARMALAAMLIEKTDWVWAAEHLAEAIPHARADEDRALLRYYLGYVRYKNGEREEAGRQLALATPHLPPDLAQKAAYYRALAAREEDKPAKAHALMQESSAGPDEEIAAAAESRIVSWSAFPRPGGWSGNATASLGVNTHPATAFLDDPGTESAPVLQSQFRADAVWGWSSGWAHGLQLNGTAYRDQNWTELSEGTSENAFEPGDFNLTLFMLQAAYIGRARSGSSEHEVRIGVDGETQFMDHVPEYLGEGQGYAPSEDPFGLYTWALGAKVWWAFSAEPGSVWAARLKVEARPNYIDENRGSVRLRLRLLNTRDFLDRALQLKVLLGGRYDRTYHDPSVIKYDRLLPEARLDLRWNTPWDRLSVRAGLDLKYNWYLNSRLNEENSFRPTYLDNPEFGEDENERFEAEYYDLERHDFEWRADLEILISAWCKAQIALSYSFHQRISNLDDAPVPMEDSSGEWRRVAATEYGYDQHMAFVGVRQRF